MVSSTAQDDSSARYIVEGEKHGLFEIRLHKLNYRGDVSLHSFAIMGMKTDDLDMTEKDDQNAHTMVENQSILSN